MDYEKKYKDALGMAEEIIRYYKEHNRGDETSIEDLEQIFPELKESEDERVRKAILELVRQSSEVLDKQNQNNMLAWLEKQGKEKTVNYPIEGMFPYTDPADTLDGEIENIWNKLRNCDNTFTAAKSGFYEVIHHFANWLEKQVKQKSTDKPKFEIGDEIKTDNEDPLTITKIDEQGYWSGDLFICSFEDSAKWELVGKIIKPKFEVGDWITNGDYTWKIIEVKPLDYILQSQDGNIVDDTISHVDEQFHSFTIEDAKDGDVLADDDNNIFIFDGTVEEGKYPFAYCGLTAQGFDSYDIRLPFTHDNNIHPATWEQRNLLFKKMKEEGYEWSEETHELKKISQRMVSAEAKEALYDKPTDEEMKELLRTEYEKGRADAYCEMYVPTQISPEESLGVSSEKYEDIVATLTQGGQKPAKWSLEDERVIAIINNALTESNTPPDDYDKVYDWLESLRKRIGG